MLVFSAMPHHLEKDCLGIEVNCPDGCGQAMAREQVAAGHAMVCEEATVACGIHGCKQTMKRRELEKHQAEQATAHEVMGMMIEQKRHCDRLMEEQSDQFSATMQDHRLTAQGLTADKKFCLRRLAKQSVEIEELKT